MRGRSACANPATANESPTWSTAVPVGIGGGADTFAGAATGASTTGG